MRARAERTPVRQPALRTADQAHLETLPGTRSMGAKVAAVAEWLASRDVGFSLADVSRKEPGQT